LCSLSTGPLTRWHDKLSINQASPNETVLKWCKSRTRSDWGSYSHQRG